MVELINNTYPMMPSIEEDGQFYMALVTIQVCMFGPLRCEPSDHRGGESLVQGASSILGVLRGFLSPKTQRGRVMVTLFGWMG